MTALFNLTERKSQLFLFFTTLLCFIISNTILGGHLFDAKALAEELYSPVGAAYEWNSSHGAPFKYRILFKEIIFLLFNLFFEQNDNSGFLISYQIVSTITYFGATFSCYWMLRSISFSIDKSFLATMLFLLMPPILMAYTVPVHTKEDLLAYTLLALSIIFTEKRRFVPLIIICVLGVLCRETLLIIPVIYLFTSENPFKKAALFFIAILTFFLIRVFYGFESHHPLNGFYWNISNIPQVVGFTFLSFGPLWLFFTLFVFKYRKNKSDHFLYKSLPLCVGLIFLTTFLGGIINEIRLLFLAFPWFLYAFLSHFSMQKWISFTGNKKKAALLFAVLALVFAGLFLVLEMYYHKFIPSSKYDIPYTNWIAVTLLQLYLTIILLPGLVKTRKSLASITFS